MDNPQAKLLSSVAYLAGLVDGEGCFTAAVLKKRRSSQFQCWITVSGTDMQALPHILEIVKYLQLPVYVETKANNGVNWKTKWILKAWSLKRCLKWIQTLKPHLIIRLPQALVMEEFILSRIRNFRKPLTVKEIDLIKKLHFLNKRGKLTASETKRRTELIEVLKIESSL